MTYAVVKHDSASWAFLCAILCGLCGPLPGPCSAVAADAPVAAAPAASFVIPAYAFDRGNAKTWIDTYADPEPMVTWGGQYPVVIEYDIDFPISAEYTFSVRFAQAELRTAQLYLDGQPHGPCCRSVTGSWNTSSARWESTCSLRIAAGKHTVRLERNGPFPHVVSLRFESPVPFPPGWKLVRSRTDFGRSAAAERRLGDHRRSVAGRNSPGAVRSLGDLRLAVSRRS